MPTTSNRHALRNASSVREQLGNISNMTLWRRMNDPELGFPTPIKISGRLYFRADEIDGWIEAQAKQEDEEQEL